MTDKVSLGSLGPATLPARILGQAQRYAVAMGWLVRRGLLERPRRLATVLGLSLAGLGAQAAAVALIYFYVGFMESGTAISALGLDPRWLAGQGGLVAMVAVLGLCLGAGHLALYGVRMCAIAWGRDHEAQCARLVLARAATLPDLAQPDASARGTERGLREMLSMEARYCGLTLRLIVLTVPTLVGFIGAAAAMFVLEPAMTAVILAVGLGIFMFQYPATLRAAVATQRWRRARSKSLYLLLAEIERRRGHPPRPAAADWVPGGLQDQPTVIAAMDTYADRMRAIEFGTLTSQLGTTVLIVVIVLAMADVALEGAVAWSFLLAYLGLLRLAAGQISGFARQVSSMARLYPQVQNLVGFLQAPRALPAALHGPVWCLHPGGGVSADPTVAAHFTAGAVVALAARRSATPPRPDLAIALGMTLAPGPVPAGAMPAAPGNPATAGPVVLVRPGRLAAGLVPRRELGLDAKVTTALWRDSLVSLRAPASTEWADAESVGEPDLDRPLAAALPPADEVRVQIAAALLRRATVIIIERDALAELGVAAADHTLVTRLCRDRLLVVEYAPASDGDAVLPDLGETVALICRGDQLETVVNLRHAAGRDTVTAVLASMPAGRNNPSAVADDVEDADFD